MKTNYFFLIIALVGFMHVYAEPVTGLQFTGASSSNIDCGYDEAIPQDQFTIEMWVNYEHLNNSGYLLSTEGHNAELGEHGFSIRKGGDSKYQFTFGGSGWNDVNSSSDILIQLWAHLAITYSDTEVVMYINGVEDTKRQLDKHMTPSPKDLYIADSPTWGGRGFTGKMADLRIWNVVRTQAEIEASMNAYLTRDEPGLVINWKMNEGEGDVIADLTGNYNLEKPADVSWFGSPSNVQLPSDDSHWFNYTTNDGKINLTSKVNVPLDVTIYNVIGQAVHHKTLSSFGKLEMESAAVGEIFVIKVKNSSGDLVTRKIVTQ